MARRKKRVTRIKQSPRVPQVQADPIPPTRFPTARATRIAGWIAMAAVVIYGTLAGFQSLNDPDMWWQMASGRYMLESGHVMRTEVFSYTAKGEPWTYPIGAGILFHWLYQLGGFTLLSLLSPLIGGSIALLLVRRGGLLRCWMVALAVPSIAAATLVRANMFTTLFAAVYLTILWDELNLADHPTPGAGRSIWILPPLMLLWVNLHPGFIYGLALVMAFAILRPRRLALCALLTLLATLVNPWTWHIYESILELLGGERSAHTFISEWKRTPVSWTVLQDWLNWREPDNYLWWLMAMALAGGMAGLYRMRIEGAGAGWRKRRWGGLLLLGSVAAAVAYTRFHGLSAVAMAIVAPDLLTFPKSKERSGDSISRYLPLVSATVLLALICWRSVDLATNRFYYTHAMLARFGPGASEWAPDRAARFIEEHHLPRQLYADYTMGGYLTWRLGPLGNQDDAQANRYPVFIDGRDLPYGLELHFQQSHMSTETFASPDWRMALEGRKVRTILVSTDPVIGYSGAPFSLLCQSGLFRLAYLDDTAAVFVRASEMTTPALDCHTVQLTPPAETAPFEDRYHFWLDAGWLYYHLGRPPEAIEAFDRARAIFDGDPFWYQMYAATLALEGKFDEAEQHLRTAIALRPTTQNIHALAELVSQRGRYEEAMDLYQQSAARAGSDAWNEWLFYSEAALNAKSPQAALSAADRALEGFPFLGAAAPLGTVYSVRLQRVRGIALLALDQPARAADALQKAAGAAPPGTRLQEALYLWLAEAYYQSGRRSDARLALDRSNAVAATLGDANQRGEGSAADRPNADGPNNERRRLEELLNAKP